MPPGLKRTMALRQPSSVLSICMSFILDTSSERTLQIQQSDQTLERSDTTSAQTHQTLEGLDSGVETQTLDRLDTRAQMHQTLERLDTIDQTLEKSDIRYPLLEKMDIGVQTLERSVTRKSKLLRSDMRH